MNLEACGEQNMIWRHYRWIAGLDVKLKKLVDLGKIGVVCSIVVAVFVDVGVISKLLK